MIGQRRRHANDEYIHLGQPCKISRPSDTAHFMQFCQIRIRNGAYITLTCIELFNLLWIDIKAGHMQAAAGGSHRQRKPDIPKAKDCDLRIQGFDLGKQGFEIRHGIFHFSI